MQLNLCRSEILSIFLLRMATFQSLNKRFSSYHMEKLTLGRIEDVDTWKSLKGFSASIDKLEVEEAHFSNASTVKQAVKEL